MQRMYNTVLLLEIGTGAHEGSNRLVKELYMDYALFTMSHPASYIMTTYILSDICTTKAFPATLFQ